MKKLLSAFLLVIGTLSLVSGSLLAACNVPNLTRCLDSVCAIGQNLNPAARCQYCGTADAGIPTQSGLRAINVGALTSNTVSDSDLKSAPANPNARYIWGMEKCFEKIPDCTTDDVIKNYDNLIQKSCDAVGVIKKSEFAIADTATKPKTIDDCKLGIRNCVLGANGCQSDFSKCKTDSEFDRVFSQCTIENARCDSFITEIRGALKTDMQSCKTGAATAITDLVSAHKNTRAENAKAVNARCTNDGAYNSCVQMACDNNLKDKCASTEERGVAETLCEFHKTACGRIKN